MMYWTKTAPLGGEIKKFPEDFVVEEKKDGRVWTTNYGLLDRLKKFLVPGKGEHIHMTMIKKNRTTIDVVNQICKQLGISSFDVGYAGLKDKRAVTSQRISVMAKTLGKLEVDKVVFKDVSRQGRKIRIGQLQGNVFTIRIRDLKPGFERVLHEFMRYEKIPNFFGPQRFGGNEEIGRALIANDLKGAVDLISKQSGLMERRIRKLSDDPKRAMRNVPKRILMLYKDAYQSHVFNRALEAYGWEAPEYLPLAGSKTEIDGVTEKILEKDCISKTDLKRSRMKGTFRKSFFKPEWLGSKTHEKDAVLKFFLPKGSYATVLLQELMKDG
jgi:tRNA pseudouridine13 synthase